MLRRRVVVTGMGMLSPLGLDVASTWEGILKGRSGIDTLEDEKFSSYPTRFGGSVKNFSIEPYLATKDARKLDLFIQYGLVAALQAVHNSGLEIDDSNCDRIGTVMGSGIGGLTNIEKTAQNLQISGPRKISPFFVPGSIINMISGILSIKLGIKGPNYAISTACATGTHCIGMAARDVAFGLADVMISGGSEMATCGLGMSGFSAARALSRRNSAPESASRPWDKERDGFVLSDGAGALILEELEHAKSRGANIYAEVIGFGMNSDAYHMTLPSPGGVGAANCMNSALRNAGISANNVQYINAHGTSTIAGDLAEVNALKAVFGTHAYNLAISSTKSMTGHLLGAAGAVEAIFSILSLVNQVAPPTINLDQSSADCNLDFIPHFSREMPINVVLSNSFGFGGTNASLVFRRFLQ